MDLAASGKNQKVDRDEVVKVHKAVHIKLEKRGENKAWDRLF